MTTSAPPLPQHEPAIAERPSPSGSGVATPGTGLGRAIRRRPWWLLIPIVLLTVAGIAAGLLRQPVYQAESRLLVGKVNPGTPTLPGFVQASTALADAYSRSIAATDVIDPVATQLRLPSLVVASRLTASPVPQSPVIRVIGEGPTARAATALSALASQRLTRYVTQLNASSGDGPKLLASYRGAVIDVGRAEARVTAFHASFAKHPTSKAARALGQARADLDATQLRARAIGAAYAGDQQAFGSSTGIVSVLALAQQASSDRMHKLELLGFVGLLVGGVLGLGLAWFREDQLSRRRPSVAG
ncbi:MAG TPA: hypothetical protein VFF79_12450 [Conexibacter sp.]|jgi:hypothetical protein|nr:hypothetical protein [Conexibacter sp.]